MKVINLLNVWVPELPEVKTDQSKLLNLSLIQN